jgi:dTDP-4-amino-4,6-dideoxygalactose transaminase
MYRIGEEEIEALREVIASRKLFRAGDPARGHTGQVDKFEREWADKTGTEHALLLSGGGTAALICALVGLGIGPGDEVIVPAYTWMATATAALSVGAIPVLAEIDETLALDPDDFARKISPRTKAVIPVHMTGRPADMTRILEVALKHGVKVVEDCCQMDGGSFQGRRVGSWGDAGAFSFNDFKILSCGEGGALVTNNRDIYERALVYHDSGANFRPYANKLGEPVFVGQQLRASEIMGAILRVQLSRLDGILADLRRIRRRFEAEMGGVGDLLVAPNNDPDGDCGVVAAFQFETCVRARAFAEAPGVGGSLPIDSDKHVYTNWTPVWEKRIGHRPDMNPYNHPANQGLGRGYSPDMCPRTLDILARTVYISLDPDWDDETVAERIAVCRKTALVL